MLVQNGSELVQNSSGMVPDTSQTLLGHFWDKTFFQKKRKKTSEKHETPRRLKTICFLRKDTNDKDAHRNSAHNDVPDSSPSFNLTPFVTKT